MLHLILELFKYIDILGYILVILLGHNFNNANEQPCFSILKFNLTIYIFNINRCIFLITNNDIIILIITIKYHFFLIDIIIVDFKIS